MWRKLVSLNLALLMLVMLLSFPAAAISDAVTINFFRNHGTTDTEPESVSIGRDYISSAGELKLYKRAPDFTDTGGVVTSYNSRADGSGQTYKLTHRIKVDSPDSYTMYAQWTPAPDYWILYIGDGVGPSKDDENKDYILDSGLSGTVSLRGGDAFRMAEGIDLSIIGWQNCNGSDEKYIVGQEISIASSSNLRLSPIVGVNYIKHHYMDRGTPPAKTSAIKFYTSNSMIAKTDIHRNEIEPKIANQVIDGKQKYFVGWNSKESGDDGQWYAGSVKDAPHELFARYADVPENNFCVLYSWLGLQGEDRKMCATVPLVDGKIAADNLPNLNEREGYIFKRWYKWPYGEEVTADTVLTSGSVIYAEWEKGETKPPNKTYTITFDGGTLTTDQNGKITQLPPTPTHPDGTFLGWFDSETNGKQIHLNDVLSGNITLYPRWSYTITFDAGEGTVSLPSAATGADGKVELPTPTRDGYDFEGWYTAADGGTKLEKDHIFTGSISIYAHWKKKVETPDPDAPKSHTVTFDSQGGSAVNSQTVADGGTVKEPENPTRSGYAFKGWFKDSTCTSAWVFATDTVTENVTLYAKWEELLSAGSYKIYAPVRVVGGSFFISHNSAYEGDHVTIRLDPWSSYELGRLSVTNLTTGQELYLSERYRDEYTFVMPGSHVEVEIFYRQRYVSYTYFIPDKPSVVSGPYAWYYKDWHIRHVVDGIVPDDTKVTRDMILSVLYNFTDHSLEDHSDIGVETTDSQMWATKNEILPDIYASGLWGMDRPLSREQLAMILYGYSQHMGYNIFPSADLTGFSDYSQVRPIARTAMSWAQATGLIPNVFAGRLAPQSKVSCGEANIILSRYISTIMWPR